MKRYIIIVENTGLKPLDRPLLMEKLRHAGFNVVDVRVATNHIEIDLLSDKAPVIDGFRIVETVEVAGTTALDPYTVFREAVELFDSERFWEAHERLEPLWRVSEGRLRKTLHGLILAAAAFVHLQKGDENGFVSIASRAAKELAEGEPSLWRLDTRKVLQHLNEASKKRQIFKLSPLFE
ncbi:MAG: DUF309 domain-containing protein [Candidatus Caldarchaeum sp.]